MKIIKTASCSANLGLILTNLSISESFIKEISENSPLLAVICGSVAMLALVLYFPTLSHLFRFSYLHPLDIAAAMILGIAAVLVARSTMAISRKFS